MSNRNPFSERTARLIFHVPTVLLAIGLATTATAGPFGFVANRDSHNVTVVDMWDHTVEATLPTAPFPSDVVASPDGATLYVATNLHLSIIDLRTLDRLDVPYAPGLSEANGIVIHPNGQTLWLSHKSATFLTEVDLSTRRTSTIAWPGFDVRHIAIDSTGANVVGVTNLGHVYQLNTATGGTATLFSSAFSFPTGIAFNDQDEVVVASDGNLTVERFAITGFGMPGARHTLASGFRPGGITSTGILTNVLVARPFDDQIERTASSPITIQLGAGANPVDVARHDDATSRLSANRGDVTGRAPAGAGSISFFTTAGVAASVPAGTSPSSATIAAERGEEVMGDPERLEINLLGSGSVVRRSIDVVSVGDDDDYVWDVDVVGPDAAAFRIIGNGCHFVSLDYQQSCTVTVEFTAIPKPRPWYAKYLRYYVPTYNASLAVDNGGEQPTLIPMQAASYLRRLEAEVKPVDAYVPRLNFGM